MGDKGSMYEEKRTGQELNAEEHLSLPQQNQKNNLIEMYCVNQSGKMKKTLLVNTKLVWRRVE